MNRSAALAPLFTLLLACGPAQPGDGEDGTKKPPAVQTAKGKMALNDQNTVWYWLNRTLLHYKQTLPEELGHGAGLKDKEWQVGGEDVNDPRVRPDTIATFVRLISLPPELTGLKLTKLTLTVTVYRDGNLARRFTPIELHSITGPKGWREVILPNGQPGGYWDERPQSTFVADLDEPELPATAAERKPYEIDLLPAYRHRQLQDGFALYPKKTYRHLIRMVSPSGAIESERPVLEYEGTPE